ncbi:MULTISPECIES: MIP/aquaporin family protein [unclassified Sporolactobacillus]|uniref:MIP/aquaporin family protein n=1 Tax=unclassified Sporolactobacillus TaxID=2628533 RepID=UPI00236860BC|nr:MIP/aquaporin family protein [Sporolactobacillus sp. CQH2019]MDD9150315.1 aquaporin family protein [Sporolactobacillus sp. CQH2019]
MTAPLITRFFAEMVGMFFLIFLGDGGCANIFLKKGREGGNWLGISLEWGAAVAVPVWLFGSISGAHLNPAVTLGLAAIGHFPWADVIPYIVAQFIGAILGAVAVYIIFYKQFEATEDKGAILGSFSTIPAVRNYFLNFVAEFLETFTLVFAIVAASAQNFAPGIMGLIVFFVIFVLVITVGGTTGCALNPARDIGPRLVHALLPIANKGKSDWAYAWIPAFATTLGGIAGAMLYVALF